MWSKKFGREIASSTLGSAVWTFLGVVGIAVWGNYVKPLATWLAQITGLSWWWAFIIVVLLSIVLGLLVYILRLHSVNGRQPLIPVTAAPQPAADGWTSFVDLCTSERIDFTINPPWGPPISLGHTFCTVTNPDGQVSVAIETPGTLRDERGIYFKYPKEFRPDNHSVKTGTYRVRWEARMGPSDALTLLVESDIAVDVPPRAIAAAPHVDVDIVEDARKAKAQKQFAEYYEKVRVMVWQAYDAANALVYSIGRTLGEDGQSPERKALSRFAQVTASRARLAWEEAYLDAPRTEESIARLIKVLAAYESVVQFIRDAATFLAVPSYEPWRSLDANLRAELTIAVEVAGCEELKRILSSGFKSLLNPLVLNVPPDDEQQRRLAVVRAVLDEAGDYFLSLEAPLKLDDVHDPAWRHLRINEFVTNAFVYKVRQDIDETLAHRRRQDVADPPYVALGNRLKYWSAHVSRDDLNPRYDPPISFRALIS